MNFFSVYVETGRSSTATTVQLVTLAATTGAKWRIRTTFIECSCPNLPDQGCTQVRSFEGNNMKKILLNSIFQRGDGQFIIYLFSFCQWFTADTGNIMTYGYGDGTGQELTAQEQTACVRKNANKCTITYTQNTSTSFIVG